MGPPAAFLNGRMDSRKGVSNMGNQKKDPEKYVLSTLYQMPCTAAEIPQSHRGFLRYCEQEGLAKYSNTTHKWTRTPKGMRFVKYG